MKPIAKLHLKVNLEKLAGIEMIKLSPSPMDLQRMRSIVIRSESSGNISWKEKPDDSAYTWEFVVKGAKRDAQNQATKIKDVCKCVRRALAAEEVMNEIVAQPFYDRVNELLESEDFNIGKYVDKR